MPELHNDCPVCGQRVEIGGDSQSTYGPRYYIGVDARDLERVLVAVEKTLELDRRMALENVMPQLERSIIDLRNEVEQIRREQQ